MLKTNKKDGAAVRGTRYRARAHERREPAHVCSRGNGTLCESERTREQRFKALMLRATTPRSVAL